MRLTINVTKQDIGMGCAADSGNCPIARAAMRALANMGAQKFFVSVGTRYLDIFHRVPNEMSKSRLRPIATSTLPPEAAYFILMFDMHEPTKAFTFDVDLELMELRSWGDIFPEPVPTPVPEVAPAPVPELVEV